MYLLLGNDVMFLNIILHACGQVKILKINFTDFDVTSSKICDRFNILIQRHIHLIHIAKKLIEAISLILLTQLFISTILLCIVGEYQPYFFNNFVIILLTRTRAIILSDGY